MPDLRTAFQKTRHTIDQAPRAALPLLVLSEPVGAGTASESQGETSCWWGRSGKEAGTRVALLPALLTDVWWTVSSPEAAAAAAATGAAETCMLDTS